MDTTSLIESTVREATTLRNTLFGRKLALEGELTTVNAALRELAWVPGTPVAQALEKGTSARMPAGGEKAAAGQQRTRAGVVDVAQRRSTLVSMVKGQPGITAMGLCGAFGIDPESKPGKTLRMDLTVLVRKRKLRREGIGVYDRYYVAA